MRSLQRAMFAAFVLIINAIECKDEKPNNARIDFKVTVKDDTNTSLLAEGGKEKLLDINIETLRKGLDKLNLLLLQQKNLDSLRQILPLETRIKPRNDNEKQKLRDGSKEFNLKKEGKEFNKIDNFEEEQVAKSTHGKDDEVQDKKQAPIPKDNNSNRSSKEHSSLSNQRKEMAIDNFMMNGV